MSEISEISDEYVAELARVDPSLAALCGISGEDEALTDYGPEGYAARADLTRRTFARLAGAVARDDADRRSAAVLREKLETFALLDEADVHVLDFSNVDGPFQRLRQSVEVLDEGGAESGEALRARIEAFSGALARLRTSLERGRQRGRVAERRMILATAAQTGPTAAYFRELAGRAGLERGARAAAAACREFGTYLTEELAPYAPERDGVGRERYMLGVRNFLGTELDLAETYTWGWEELAALQRDLARTAEQILPGASLPEVRAELDARHRMPSGEPFRAWIQELADRAISDLDGVHFDIPGPLRRIECRTPPTGDAIYYLAPSEDLSRPGRVWYATQGEETPTWTVPAIMFHEGVPGHHLQLGATVLEPSLHRFQRVGSELHPGWGEGWGLYAERLMDELGRYPDPAHRFGMLDGGRLLRTIRVILDIGLHLGLRIPADSAFHPGERWTRDLAVAFLREHSPDHDDVVAWEVDRYLGLPAQAISYRLGERVWLAGREAARTRHGAGFDLKGFHTAALRLGPMGLGLLTRELASL
ncbi:DUF885 domain-containing protein [Actinocorallia sp. B10E7]|uniref:DUF885 domain-containing protein n=1 Tax=Actinocorallia sp. B10E7 TaxID=3153558 RepID=UPI00325D9E4F